MDAKECSGTPLFVTLVEQLHSLEPSADSAYYLGILNDKKGNFIEPTVFYDVPVESKISQEELLKMYIEMEDVLQHNIDL